MSITGSEDVPASYGTAAGFPRFLPVSSSGSAVFFEWLVGRTALARRIGTGFFPPVGALAGIADFLDRACSISEVRRTVWDANWSSVFPCANGSASDILTQQAVHGIPIADVPGTKTSPIDATIGVSKSQGRRYQTLYILNCNLAPHAPTTSANPFASFVLLTTLERFLLHIVLGLSSLAILYGLYGTAACLFVTIVFRLLRRLARVTRPPGYLSNNEDMSVCMLVAIHENASTWYLYCGSRAVVDTLLNKSMIHSITSPLGTVLPWFLRALAAFQLAALTFVAAQKGWDGVGLLAPVTVDWATDRLCYTEGRLARSWMRREGVAVTARGFRFSGRTAMLGAIQLLKEKKATSWMDGILAPSPRREVWLARLNGQTDENLMSLEKQLSSRDQAWLELNSGLAYSAADVMRPAFGSPITAEC
ncbi:uncharacterized protein B0T15DRAFT_564051 [Chaetomium strumarium]|uniref:Uncharacterized protein n=1 Tax=Chaetomium strumarium TaxID=1170767 RepID=A0AAJ0M5H1_9PEZI|nr:hypothetical protein B0T15DRAFT_564051 [Chaetomium strumarium]